MCLNKGMYWQGMLFSVFLKWKYYFHFNNKGSNSFYGSFKSFSSTWEALNKKKYEAKSKWHTI